MADTETENEAESLKRRLLGDLLIERYVESKEDMDKWLSGFETDLESYVQVRIRLASSGKDQP